MYSDFFAAPRGAMRGKGKAPASPKVNGVKAKDKGKGKEKQRVRFGEDEVEDERPDGQGEADDEGDRDVIGRFKGDLFDDDEEEEEAEKSEYDMSAQDVVLITLQTCRHTRSSNWRWLSRLPSWSKRLSDQKIGPCLGKRRLALDQKTRYWRRT